MAPYRFRQCPKCKVILPAGKFGNTQWGAAWQDGRFGRYCPKCHWVGETSKLAIVAERHKLNDGTIIGKENVI